MPAFGVHFLVCQKALEKLESELRNRVHPFLEWYQLGSVGPDLPYYPLGEVLRTAKGEAIEKIIEKTKI